MIIGRGSIANMLNDRKGFIFFACGVSDSGIKNMFDEAVGRELGEIIPASLDFRNEMFVYFSTISIFTVKSFYTNHKKQMEQFVRDHFRNYSIIRLGNVWECTNPKTFLNSYENKPYQPRDEYKFMISAKQLRFVTNNLPITGQNEISIFGEMLKVQECINQRQSRLSASRSVTNVTSNNKQG